MIKTIALIIFALVILYFASLALPKGDALCGGACPTETIVVTKDVTPQKHTKTPTEVIQDTNTPKPPPTDTDVPPTATDKPKPTNTDSPPTNTDVPPTEFIPTDTIQPTDTDVPNTPTVIIKPTVTRTELASVTPGLTMTVPETGTATKDPTIENPTNTAPATFPPPSNPKVTLDKDRVLPITGGDFDLSGLGITSILLVLGFGFVVFGLKKVRK